MQRVALISNPGSGSAEELDPAAVIRESGVEVEEFAIEDAADAAEADVDRIVVAGGDGSIAPAAAASARAGVDLGVIPAGTANDFAVRMGLPEDPEEATRLAASGRGCRAVDLGRLGDRPFVNVASLGLSPVAAEIADDLKQKLGALAYTVGALRAATREKPIACEIRCDGEPLFSGEAWQVMIGCTGAFGGGSQIDADADDGRLDVVVIEGGSRAALAKHALGLRSGKVESQKGVQSHRCAAIEVAVDSGLELNVDGELIEAAEVGGERLSFSVEPQAVRLVQEVGD